MTFGESWATAEKAVYNELLRVTGCVDARTAFLGLLPAVVPCWSLNTGKIANTNTTWPTDIVSLHFMAELTGQFTERAKCLAWGMTVMKALPFVNLADGGNVQCFRIREGGFGEPLPDAMPLANENRKALIFVLKIGCEMVFSTGGGWWIDFPANGIRQRTNM